MALRKRPVVAGVVLSTGIVAVGVAAGCVDLFHGFDDLKNACGQTTACPDDASTADAADGGERAFCDWSQDEAHDFAAHACTWLGACEAPMGQNQMGACMVQATLAFNCTANATMPVNGELRDYWNALRTVTSCKDVHKLTRASGACAAERGTFSSCAFDGGDTRVECQASNGRAPGERCLMTGQTCDWRYEGNVAVGRCVGPDRIACTTTRCDGTVLHACSDAGIDVGRDCRYFGDGTCLPSDAGVACAPLADAGTCKPTREVTCSGAVATGCVAGRRETIDCNRVLAGSACRSIVLAPGEALASACSGNDALTADGGPLADGCSGGDVRGSANGKTVFVSCRAQGLGNCRLVPVISQPPGQRNAACAPPADGG